MESWQVCSNYTVWHFDTLLDEKRAANNSKSWEMKGLENLSYCSHCSHYSHPKGQGAGGAGVDRMSESLLAGAIIYLRPRASKRDAGKRKLENGNWKIESRKSKIPRPYVR